MEKLLNLLLRGSSFLVFGIVELSCLWLVVNFNSAQADIWMETKSVYLGGVNEWVARRTAYFDLDEENAILRRQNARLLAQLPGSAYDTKVEKDSVVDAERFLQRFTYLSSRVVNKSPYGPNNTLVIDRGEELGVSVGQGVVADVGLVGVVSAVTTRHARVFSILHQDVRISAGLKGGAFGTLRWDGKDPRRVTVRDIPDYVNVTAQKDTVFTTGYSNVFPTGIPIGVVESVEAVAGTGSQLLTVVLLEIPIQVETAYVVQDLFKEELEALFPGVVK